MPHPGSSFLLPSLLAALLALPAPSLRAQETIPLQDGLLAFYSHASSALLISRQLSAASTALLALPTFSPPSPSTSSRSEPPTPPAPPIAISPTEIDFERHVMPLFTRGGCNTGSCHGSLQGESDFQLSLFGHDPAADFAALVHPEHGPFADPQSPEKSPLLRKPTNPKHKGGERFSARSHEYQILQTWIAAGAPHQPGSGTVTQLSLSPQKLTFSRPGASQKLRVEATFADGSRSDVTLLCKFESRDDHVASVREDGTVRALHPGDAAIVVSYGDRVLAGHALVASPAGPLESLRRRSPLARSTPPPVNPIDREVFSRLSSLNLLPSPPATDEEFLRRVTIDTIGQLPSPDQVRAFLQDTDPKKRERRIEELLQHPLHAALWATLLSDLTGNDTGSLEEPREKRSKMWHDWLRHRIAENVPYHHLARDILLATSRQGENPASWIQQSTRIDESALRGFDTPYQDRESLDLFWSRRNFSLEQKAEQTAAAFLGVQLGCAQCHKHPYDRWTQADYRAYANLFGQVKHGLSPDAKKAIEEENKRRSKIKKKEDRLPNLKEVYLETAKPDQLKDPKSGKSLAPAVLGGPALAPGGDYRQALYDWLTQPDNPFFAPSFVNRVWAHYMGTGIVEPVDGFSAANPPSNEALLDFLTRDFIAHGYDLRHLERSILNSRVYQLSSTPNETNAADKRNYARKYPRRLIAEVAVDVIDSALGITGDFTKDAPKGSRAIEVAASRVQDSNLGYAFNVFGRPPRTTVCACERSTDPALPQTLYLMTDSRIQEKIRNGRLKSLLSQDKRLDLLRQKKLPESEAGAILDDLFLATLTRFPSEPERQAAVQHLQDQPGSEKPFEDLLWALLNTREFILNH